MLLIQQVSSIPASTITASSLPVVVKVVGFVVSWTTTIYFLWLRRHPKILTDLSFFVQTKQISIIVTSVFLMLTWGALATSSTLPPLITLAISLTAFGIVAYFIAIFWIMRAQESQSVIKSAKSVALLLLFFIYTAFISCGLTSAAVFLAVLLTNPANAATGAGLAKPEEFTVALRVVSKNVISQNQDSSFRISSGQANFGCQENKNFHVEFNLPQGSTPVAQTASFLNLDNAKLLVPPSVSAKGNTLLADGVLRGLDYENFPLGIRNCPGGGHGELVLSGVYRSTSSHEEQVPRILYNDLSNAATEPVLVTLPDLTLVSVEATCKPKGRPGKEYQVTVSPDHPSASDGPFQVAYLPEKKQISLFLRR